jgi:membrane protease YdiL (CAAX protease family)
VTTPLEPIDGTPARPAPPARTARVRAAFEVVLCSSAPTQLLISGALLMAGMPSMGVDGGLSLPFVVAVSLLDTAVLLTLMVTLTRAHGHRVSDLWLGTRPALPEAWRGLLLVPVITGVVIALVVTLRTIAPWLRNVETNPLEAFARGGAVEAAALGVVVIVAGGVREELQRAFVLQRFERYLGGAGVGVVVSSAAFGAGHAMQGWDAAVITGLLGAFWAVLYLVRRSSIAPVVSHAGFNSLEVLRVALAAAAGR